MRMTGNISTKRKTRTGSVTRRTSVEMMTRAMKIVITRRSTGIAPPKGRPRAVTLSLIAGLRLCLTWGMKTAHHQSKRQIPLEAKPM